MTISVANGDGRSLTFHDQEDGRQIHVELDTTPELERVDTEFPAPVDVGIAVRCSTLRLRELPLGHIRTAGGRISDTIDPSTEVTLQAGTHHIELHASMKMHLVLQGPARVFEEDGRFTVVFPTHHRVSIGVRSYHERPTDTITVTDDPADLFVAVSHFGSSLKTTTPERSYPTLRGHPPLIELGEKLRTPPPGDPPSSGVTLELPVTHESAFVAAPLAYYLGADLVPGETPQLVTANGYTYDLTRDGGFVEEVTTLLKHVFLCDVVVRTEGFYDAIVPAHADVEPLLERDPADLYTASRSEQIEAYLEVPYRTTAPHVPQWGLTVDIPCRPEMASVLSHVTARLAVIRPARHATLLSADELRAAIVRDHLSDTESRGGAEVDVQLVEPPGADSMEHVWFGEGIPFGATKGVEAAYEHRYGRSADGACIDIVVVANGGVGETELGAVEAAHDNADYLPMSVTTHHDLSTDDLAAVLEQPAGFFHYIGHVDPEGFRCPDGHLDASSVSGVAVKAFLLNGCSSYSHGIALVEGGSAGGIVTFGDVLDDEAGHVGVATARLLQRGFPLQPAYRIARRERLTGSQYLIVGDGMIDVTQSRNGPPILCDAERCGDSETWEVTLYGYLPHEAGMGTLVKPYLGDTGNYLLPGELTTIRVSTATFREHVERYREPFRIDGGLHWRPDGIPD